MGKITELVERTFNALNHKIADLEAENEALKFTLRRASRCAHEHFSEEDGEMLSLFAILDPPEEEPIQKAAARRALRCPRCKQESLSQDTGECSNCDFKVDFPPRDEPPDRENAEGRRATILLKEWDAMVARAKKAESAMKSLLAERDEARIGWISWTVSKEHPEYKFACQIEDNPSCYRIARTRWGEVEAGKLFPDLAERVRKEEADKEGVPE